MCAFSAVLTTPAHSPEQPAAVSDLSLHERSRRAHLHHQCSTTTSDTIFYIAPSSCVRGAQISASFHHASRRDSLSSDMRRETIRKVSFKLTSRRSLHLRTDQDLPSQRPNAKPTDRYPQSICQGDSGCRHPQPSEPLSGCTSTGWLE